MNEKFFVSGLHSATKRNYIERMNNNKVHCMKIAKKYGKDYWDDVVNLGDFQHPTPPIYGKKYKHQFGVKIDLINTDRNVYVQEMEEEDKRIDIMEQDMNGSSSDSEYYSD